MASESRFKPRARIVYVCNDKKSLAALTMPFREVGYALLPPEAAANADLGLIDLRGKTISGKKALAVANLLRRNSPECSLFFIVDEALEQIGQNALKRYGEVIFLTGSPAPIIERCRQMMRLRNIAEETGERLKSLATLNRLAEFPSIAAPAAPPRILIAGAPGAAALTAVNAVSRIAAQCVCVLTAGQAMRALDHGDFDGAIFIPKSGNNTLLSLTRVLRRHPKYCWMPIIHVADNADNAAAYVQKGAKDFILMNHIEGGLAAKTKLAVRRARLLKTMRHFLQACAGEGVRDASSGAFTAAFLAEHGARLCARADQTKRPLASIALRLVAQNQDGGAIEPDRQALHSAARLINRVTRAEDVVARIAPGTFLILTPATHEEDAAKAALRFVGILENTVFRNMRNQLLYAVTAHTAVCTRPQGLCIEELVALNLNKLRAVEKQSTKQPQRRSPQ